MNAVLRTYVSRMRRRSVIADKKERRRGLAVRGTAPGLVRRATASPLLFRGSTQTVADFSGGRVTAGDGEQEDVVKIRLWDKIKPLELLMRHLHLVGEQGADTGGVDWQLLASKMAEIRAILRRAAPQLPPAIDITPEPDITPDRPGPEALAQRLKTGGPR